MHKGIGLFRTHGVVLNHLFQLGEMCLIAVCLIVATHFAEYPWNPMFNALLVMVLVLFNITARRNELYSSRRGRALWLEMRALMKSWLLIFIFCAMTFFLGGMSGTNFRNVLVIWFLVGIIMLTLERTLLRITFRFIRKKGFNRRHAIIVGAGPVGMNLARNLENTIWSGIKVIGFFDDKAENVSNRIPILGKTTELDDFLSNHNIDYVYIALPMRAEEKIKRIIDKCRTFGAELYMVPDFFTFYLLNSKIESIGNTIMLNFNPYMAWKRYFDLFFSIIAIIVSLPVTLVISLLIKIEDGGPILYSHKRVTSAGKEFGCLKFRTMTVNADKKLAEIIESDPEARKEWDKHFKLKNDPRVTRIGKFLRKTSLDELPQFLNVLRGEMSVVGARPIVEKELYNYYKDDGGLYCSMKPGITGPWQIGKRSDTEDYDERVQLDKWYVQNYSLWLDLKIIFRTIASVLHSKGAY